MSALRNIGPKSTKWLQAVGIESQEDLEEVGSVVAFMMVRDAGFAPTLNFLYGLEAALQNRHWLSLDATEKASLRRQISPHP